MNPRDFCYWLRGFFELAGEGDLTEDQVKTISDHLKLVMEEKPKPSNWPPFPATCSACAEGWCELPHNKAYRDSLRKHSSFNKPLPEVYCTKVSTDPKDWEKIPSCDCHGYAYAPTISC